MTPRVPSSDRQQLAMAIPSVGYRVRWHQRLAAGMGIWRPASCSEAAAALAASIHGVPSHGSSSSATSFDQAGAAAIILGLDRPPRRGSSRPPHREPGLPQLHRRVFRQRLVSAGAIREPTILALWAPSLT